MEWNQVDKHLNDALSAINECNALVAESKRQAALASDLALEASVAALEARRIYLRMARKGLLFQKGAM